MSDSASRRRDVPAEAREPARVASPCTDVCRIDPASGWCEGCLRTIDEIAAWGSLDDAGRRRIWQRLAERRRVIAAARDST
jgi:uncharacterized protein